MRQTAWQAVVQRQGLEHEFAFGLTLTGAIELEAAGDIGARCARQGVQGAAGLPRVARHFGHAFFVPVQFFQHNHRQKNIVFLKAEQAHRVVQQHVGVQHK